MPGPRLEGWEAVEFFEGGVDEGEFVDAVLEGVVGVGFLGTGIEAEGGHVVIAGTGEGAELVLRGDDIVGAVDVLKEAALEVFSPCPDADGVVTGDELIELLDSFGEVDVAVVLGEGLFFLVPVESLLGVGAAVCNLVEDVGPEVELVEDDEVGAVDGDAADLGDD